MYVPIISNVVDGIISLFKNKQEQKKIEIKGNIKRIERADNKEAEWEKIMAEGSKGSWKDEFWTIILAIPLILCFVPLTVPYIREGFAVLETMPEYYRYWLGLAIGAAFAVRQFKK